MRKLELSISQRVSLESIKGFSGNESRQARQNVLQTWEKSIEKTSKEIIKVFRVDETRVVDCIEHETCACRAFL